MVTVTQPNSNSEIVDALESLEHPLPEQDHDDAVMEEQEELPERSADVEEAEMIVHPLNTAVQVMGLCQKLKENLRAEIIHVLKSQEGTIIRLALRSEGNLQDFLAKEADVSEVWQELIPRGDRPALLPQGVDSEPIMKDGMAVIVYVALKPSYIDALISSKTLAVAG